jgi:hypothetical protein
MRKIINSIILVSILFLSLTNVNAGMHAQGYSLLVSGDFDMPDVIKDVKKSSELKPFLEEHQSQNQLAAIRRLGEIEGNKAVTPLVKMFNQEPNIDGTDYYPITKYEILRTLGRIGTKEAKNALLEILKDYWKRLPGLRVIRNGKVSVYPGEQDFASVVPVILESLYKWSSDNDVYEFAKTIAENSDVKKYYGGNIGIKAWEISLNGEMLRKGIVKEIDATKYCLDLENDLAKNGKAYSEENGILKMNAVREILNQRVSENIMSSLIDEFKKEQEKEPRDKGLTTRYLELRDKIDNLEYYIKSKKEAKAKLDAYKKQVSDAQQKDKSKESNDPKK